MKNLNTSLKLGIIGITVLIVINLAAIAFINQVFFSSAWWSSWFPAYLVFLIFTIIGISKQRNNANNVVNE